MLPVEIRLPKAFRNRLIESMKKQIQKALNCQEQNPSDHPKFHHNFLSDRQIHLIRYDFFCVNAELFKNYKEFMKYDMPDKSQPSQP